MLLLPGSVVLVDGLASTAGQLLNGRRATVLFWVREVGPSSKALPFHCLSTARLPFAAA